VEADDESHDSPAEEEDFVPSPPLRAVQGKSSMASGVKKRSKREEKEIISKDERKLSKERTSTTHGSKRSRQDVEDIADPVSDKHGSNTPEPTIPADPINESGKEREPVTKKRKLPAIKKIKNVGSASSTPAPSLKQEAAEGGKEKDSNPGGGDALPPLPSTVQRKPAATAGNADLDLTNMDVYKQLFSVCTGINTGLPELTHC
jgi:hypothetical protein